MTPNVRTPKRGERYRSNVWLMPDYTQQTKAIVKITKVTKHAIFYRPDYGYHEDGTLWLGSVIYIKNTPEAIGRWLGEQV